MSFPETPNLEPKKIFELFLIRVIEYAGNSVFFGRGTDAVGAMEFTIAILDDQAKTHFKEVYQELTEFEVNTSGMTRPRLKQIYFDMMTYLNKTYLADVHLGIIPASTLKGEVPIPKNEATPERLSAKL